MNKIFEANEQLRIDIKQAPLDILIDHGIVTSARKTGTICRCGNGSGKDGTGMHSFWCNDTLLHKCYVCGETFDNLDLIAQHFNLDVKRDFPKVLAEGATLLGGRAHSHSSSVPARIPVKMQSEDMLPKFMFAVDLV